MCVDMLECLSIFREKLDSVMCESIGKRIILYGYGRTGRFLEWYADYYHSIKMDYIITSDWSSALPYSLPYFRDSLFDFNYSDVKDAIIWLALPGIEEAKIKCEKNGYIFYDFAELIYGENLIEEADEFESVYKKRKTGIHDVQFMEYLEAFYKCNFVTAVDKEYLAGGGIHSYAITTQAEIFPMLDKCHVNIGANDAIFDFGCGKGGAMLSFLDYGFEKVGGVEFTKELCDEAVNNFELLQITSNSKYSVEIINNDAAKVTMELDSYNWFYFFDPFEKEVFEKVVENIYDSFQRKRRKITIININPRYYRVFEKYSIFKLTNQFCASTRQKVVNIYITQ